MRAVSVVAATAVACFLSYCVTSSFADAQNPPAGSPTADGGTPSAEGGAGDGSTTESTPHYLTPQAEEATFAKVRVEREAEIAEAQRAHEAAVEALTKMKQALVKYTAARKKVEAADAGALRDEVNNELTTIVTEAVALYPAFDVTSADAGTGGDQTPAFKSAVDALELKVKAAETKLAEARAAKKAAEKEIDDLKTNSSSLRLRFRAARLARCKTAWCFGGDDGTEYAFEPALDLPFGASVSVGEGALARYHNTTDFTFQFTAGLRFWMLHDYVSFSLLFARVIYSTTDKISVPGSAMEHSTGDIRRLGPTFALGLFGDLLFVGVGYDQLRNGRGDTRDPAYAPDQVLSRSVTFSLGFAPFTAIRNVAGASK